jgi:hypothetical protein
MFLKFDTAGMDRESIAKTFNAYLCGSLVADNYLQGGDGQLRYRPSQKQGSDADWQLDESNDYFLHFREDGSAELSCRYPPQEQTLQAMKLLFEARYKRPNKDRIAA